KPSVAEQRGLATKVPALLKRLTNGLNGVGVDNAVRTGFYQDLMKLHTTVMALDAKKESTGTVTQKPSVTATTTKAPVAAAAGKGPTATLTKAPAGGAAAPPKPAEEESLDFTADITVKVGDAEVKVDDALDFTEAAAPSLAPAGPAAGVKPGMDPKSMPGGL